MLSSLMGLTFKQSTARKAPERHSTAERTHAARVQRSVENGGATHHLRISSSKRSTKKTASPNGGSCECHEVGVEDPSCSCTKGSRKFAGVSMYEELSGLVTGWRSVAGQMNDGGLRMVT